MMKFQRLVSQNIRSGHLRAFAFARLESQCCLFLPWMSETYFSLHLHLHQLLMLRCFEHTSQLFRTFTLLCIIFPMLCFLLLVELMIILSQLLQLLGFRNFYSQIAKSHSAMNFGFRGLTLVLIFNMVMQFVMNVQRLVCSGHLRACAAQSFLGCLKPIFLL